jgi:hypothetical protein
MTSDWQDILEAVNSVEDAEIITQGAKVAYIAQALSGGLTVTLSASEGLAVVTVEDGTPEHDLDMIGREGDTITDVAYEAVRAFYDNLTPMMFPVREV